MSPDVESKEIKTKKADEARMTGPSIEPDDGEKASVARKTWNAPVFETLTAASEVTGYLFRD